MCHPPPTGANAASTCWDWDIYRASPSTGRRSGESRECLPERADGRPKADPCWNDWEAAVRYATTACRREIHLASKAFHIIKNKKRSKNQKFFRGRLMKPLLIFWQKPFTESKCVV